MKKKLMKIEAKIGVGRAQLESVATELRKQYGPMLKRLAGQTTAQDHERRR
jgi:hypothetical protein